MDEVPKKIETKLQDWLRSSENTANAIVELLKSARFQTKLKDGREAHFLKEAIIRSIELHNDLVDIYLGKKR